MTPLPKRKLSKGRGARRRSHQALTAPTLAECPNCHAPLLQHHVCPTCGSYKKKVVVVPKAKPQEKTS